MIEKNKNGFELDIVGSKILYNSDGKDTVVIYCTKENKRLTLPASRTIRVDSELIQKLQAMYGEKNVTTT